MKNVKKYHQMQNTCFFIWKNSNFHFIFVMKKYLEFSFYKRLF